MGENGKLDFSFHIKYFGDTAKKYPDSDAQYKNIYNYLKACYNIQKPITTQVYKYEYNKKLGLIYINGIKPIKCTESMFANRAHKWSKNIIVL